jgi:hypothetical protein
VAHFIIGKSEAVLPEFLHDCEQESAMKQYESSGHPDLDSTPLPSWDLLRTTESGSPMKPAQDKPKRDDPSYKGKSSAAPFRGSADTPWIWTNQLPGMGKMFCSLLAGFFSNWR